MVNIKKQDMYKSHISTYFFTNYWSKHISGRQGFVKQGINCIFALLFNKETRGKGNRKNQ
ncbi:hypothetical protein DKG77_14820 [Flagellimonas aquimarina]|jgi:hypothetical protein|uniref:Uncharacterized protein n=1 Tax=Flagellimonas aquimarina TaxID=2201895 RepID=A0A316KTP3_9FLAO|nr:hypothetical protein DKG77_14820 [Allomuricauda koreensis]